jgi:dipeptidyl aminopeptidase/acylaminoacyl peptidase
MAMSALGKYWCALFAVCALIPTGWAQTNVHTEPLPQMDAQLKRQLNLLLWSERLRDVATLDTLHFASPAKVPATNDLIIPVLTFRPRAPLHFKKRPLIVFAHGEIHGNVVTDEEPHIVRELLEQGYMVAAPDYRGSSGYGPEFWRAIDYGALEVEDVDAARQLVLDRYPDVDPARVGVIGWSHGGCIALLAAMNHPRSYRACYAGVPVSDLAERIRIRGKEYQDLFAAPYHIGKTPEEVPEEYRRRSPAWNAWKLQTPLLIQANTMDEDVTFEEVSRLLSALERNGKNFQAHVYTNAPGGHYFNRLDTPQALESRREVWRFLASSLHPPHASK